MSLLLVSHFDFEFVGTGVEDVVPDSDQIHYWHEEQNRASSACDASPELGSTVRPQYKREVCEERC